MPRVSGFAQIAKARIEKGQKGQWKKPPNLEEGLETVRVYLKFVRQANPRIWIMENVDGLAKHLPIKPRAFGAKIKGNKRHVFYGNFPSILIPQTSCIPMGKFKGEKLKS